jgi:glycosyltransferase involved in cell wall biosynthesis
MKKILIVTDVDFWTKSSGNRSRISNLVEFLSKHVQLSVLCVKPGPNEYTREASISRHGNITLILMPSRSSPQANGEYANSLLKGQEFDSIIIEYIHNTYFLKFLNIGWAKLILDVHDIMSDKQNEFKRYDRPVHPNENFDEATEFAIFSMYHNILVLCDSDCARINSAVGQKAILCSHSSPTYGRTIRSIVQTIGFVASEYLPNIDGINFFIENCWPSLSTNTDIKLLIFGNVCRNLNHRKSHNVVLKGFVQEPASIYEEIDIVINPVQFGAGIKIKNIEALANGRPLVTTSHGSRGIEGAIGNSLFVADKPSEFVSCLRQLIDHAPLRHSMSQNAHRFINEHFLAEKSYSQLLELVTS